MAVYSYAQLMSLWINAGGSKALAPVAAAIAEAESGGNSDALNPNDNGGTQSSFGLWQISTGTHAPPSPNWASPAVNAQLAVAKYNGAKGFSPWGTYDSGAYKAFLSPGTTPDPSVPGSSTATAAEATAAVSADCFFGFPALNVGIIPGIYSQTVLPGGCILTKSGARGMMGALFMVAGALVFLPGLILIVAGEPHLAAAAGLINKVPAAGQVTVKVEQGARATAARAPWYQRSNNPENLNPLNSG